jgi:hypothetical protein
MDRATCGGRPQLCYLAGGELEHSPFLPGHSSVQTTER